MKIKKKISVEFKHSLREKYKLVIMNRNTYEEKFSIELSPLFVFVFLTISSLVLIVFTTLLITVTPLREYIPGYGSSKQRQKIIKIQIQLDSLQQTLAEYEIYSSHIKKIFADESFADDTMAFQQTESGYNKKQTFAFSKEDSLLMQMDLKQNNLKISEERVVPKSKRHSYSLLFPPFRGVVLSLYNASENRYGIRVQIDSQHSIYAISSGNVVYSNKLSDGEILLMIHHPEEMISVYRYRGTVLVEQGAIVKAGQLIGKGDLKPLSIYFELWINGKPVNPQDRIIFN